MKICVISSGVVIHHSSANDYAIDDVSQTLRIYRSNCPGVTSNDVEEGLEQEILAFYPAGTWALVLEGTILINTNE